MGVGSAWVTCHYAKWKGNKRRKIIKNQWSGAEPVEEILGMDPRPLLPNPLTQHHDTTWIRGIKFTYEGYCYMPTTHLHTFIQYESTIQRTLTTVMLQRGGKKLSPIDPMSTNERCKHSQTSNRSYHNKFANSIFENDFRKCLNSVSLC